MDCKNWIIPETGTTVAQAVRALKKIIRMTKKQKSSIPTRLQDARARLGNAIPLPHRPSLHKACSTGGPQNPAILLLTRDSEAAALICRCRSPENQPCTSKRISAQNPYLSYKIPPVISCKGFSPPPNSSSVTHKPVRDFKA